MTQVWSSWLDQLEESISAQRTALAEGRHDDVLGGQPPTGLGPLPVELEARARSLLQENASLTAELATACASHGRQLKLLCAIEPRRPGSSYLDTRT